MKVLGSIGSYLDGWAKFALTVVAIGWFSLQFADRYSPRSATLTIGQPDVASARSNAETVQTAEFHQTVPAVGPSESRSVASDLVREFWLAVSFLTANSVAQLAAVLAVGVTGGLAIRPKVNQWRESRAVRSARRRANRQAADLRLLAAHDAKGNVAGPSSAIQPMKRH